MGVERTTRRKLRRDQLSEQRFWRSRKRGHLSRSSSPSLSLSLRRIRHRFAWKIKPRRRLWSPLPFHRSALIILGYRVCVIVEEKKRVESRCSSPNYSHAFFFDQLSRCEISTNRFTIIFSFFFFKHYNHVDSYVYRIRSKSKRTKDSPLLDKEIHTDVGDRSRAWYVVDGGKMDRIV